MFSCNQCVHNLALNVLFHSHDWLVKFDMLLQVWWVWTPVVDLWWGPVNWQQHPHGSPFTYAILCQKSAASETPMGSFGRLPKVSRKTSATTYSTTKNRRRDQTLGWKSWTHTSSKSDQRHLESMAIGKEAVVRWWAMLTLRHACVWFSSKRRVAAASAAKVGVVAAVVAVLVPGGEWCWWLRWSFRTSAMSEHFVDAWQQNPKFQVANVYTPARIPWILGQCFKVL